MTNPTPTIAVFDFDGTLVTKDTFLALLKIGFKTQPWRCAFLILLWPVFVINYLLRGDRSLPKSVMLWCLTAFRGKKGIIKFLTKSLDHSPDVQWFKEGQETLRRLHAEKTDVIIATASGQIWIRSLLRKKFRNSKMIIGTRLKFFAGGAVLSGKNCKEREKLRRVQEHIQTSNLFLNKNPIWMSSWSDHIADLPILKTALTAYIICPKSKHLHIFKKELGENLDILNWSAE